MITIAPGQFLWKRAPMVGNFEDEHEPAGGTEYPSWPENVLGCPEITIEHQLQEGFLGFSPKCVTTTTKFQISRR